MEPYRINFKFIYLVTLYTTLVMYLYNLLVCKEPNPNWKVENRKFWKMKYKCTPKHIKGSHPSHKIKLQIETMFKWHFSPAWLAKILKFNTIPASAEAVENSHLLRLLLVKMQNVLVTVSTVCNFIISIKIVNKLTLWLWYSTSGTLSDRYSYSVSTHITRYLLNYCL